ncbi:AAA family ATPase [Tenacibaculum dicentrarchi]|nr:AAA family ATPase [Tenacibaculum dicentrarchi]
MIYIRNIFKQDLRGGKQIAFTKESSNVFFEFDFRNPDPDRQISFTFKESDSSSTNYQYNGTLINTRLYAAGSEARIDSELKTFLVNSLKTAIDDIIVFSRKTNVNSFNFTFIPKNAPNYNFYKQLLNGGNHQISVIESVKINENIEKGYNKIYYGAPGTGKSHKVNEITEKLERKFWERITFHPEFDYASFVGGYKPISEQVKVSKEGEDEKFSDEIKYKFTPQSFINIYIKAWQGIKEDKNYFLVIEEINRGNCAEIFGDIFQLLDRNSNYTVTPSNELNVYLIKELGADHPGIKDGLKLPENLIILATMNTSDQSLFPMDSAFKRRWDWEYIPINYKENYIDDKGESKENKSFEYQIIDKEEKKIFDWINFIKTINNIIKSNENLGMDKCIGNFFVKPNDDKNISLEVFINKVIFYLWNDVFKDEEDSENIFPKAIFYEDFFPIKEEGFKTLKLIVDKINKIAQNKNFDSITLEK